MLVFFLSAMESARAGRRTTGLKLLWVLPLCGAGASWAQELGDAAASSGLDIKMSVSAVAAFSINTTSKTLSSAKIRTDPGYLIGTGLGYRIGELRVEGKVTYGRYEADRIRFAEGGGALSGYFDQLGAAVELYYQPSSNTRLSPYLGAGIGVARFRANDVTLAGFPQTLGETTLPTYQFMAGISYVTSAWDIGLGYSYLRFGAQDYETGGATFRGDPVGTHALQLSARRSF